MAASFVQTLGTSSVKAAGTTLATTFGATTAAGNVLVARVLFDNAATASKPVVSSISKPAGEVASWVFLGAARSTSTSAGAFASGELWAIRTTVAWPAAAVTVTVDTSTTMMANLFMEFSGVTVTQRSTVGTNYSTTTTAASATTTGTTPQVGDLALGFLFGSNVAVVQAGDTDTTGGSWSAAVGLGSTGGNVATNNFGLGQHKILTAASHQTYNNSAAMTAGNGAIVAILAATFATATMTLAATATASTTSTASLSLVAREFHRPWVEDFSGGDWSRWDSSIGFSGDLATTLTVVGGAGFISTQGSPRCCPIVAPAIAATIADQGVTLTITPSSNITTNDRISLVLRGDGTWGTVGSSSLAPRPGTGYRLELQPNTIPQLFIDSNGAATENFPGGTTGGSNIVMTAGTPIKVRFEAVGVRLRWRSWLASDTEPTGWTVTTYDDFTATSGLLGLSAFLFSTDVSYTVDDISWYLPSFPASSNASLSIKATHFALPWGEDFSGGDWSRWLDTPWTGDVVSNPPLRVSGGGGALASSRAGNSGGVNVYIADAIGKPQTDQGILVTVIAGSSNTAADLFSLIIRGDGTWASGTTTSQPGAGYKLLMWPGSAGDMYAVSGGTSTYLSPTTPAGATVEMAAGGPMKVRFEAVGQQIRFRSWMDGDPEPTTWRTSANTTTVASGIAGMGVWINSANNQYSVDDFQWYIPANTNNASLAIAATGVAIAAGTSTAALTLAANASAQAQASATASLAISATPSAIGKALATATASLNINALHFAMPWTEEFGDGDWSRWTASAYTGGTLANGLTVAAGVGQMATSNPGATGGVRGYPSAALGRPFTDQGVLLTVTPSSNATVNDRLYVTLRGDGTWGSTVLTSTFTRPGLGYRLALYPGTIGLNVDYNNGANENLIASTKPGGSTIVPAAGTGFKVRFEAVGARLRYRTWLVGNSEPTTWATSDADDTLAVSGIFGMATSFTTATANYKFDDIQWYEVIQPGSTATASLTIAASGSAVAAGTSTAALTISGTATGTATDTATASMSLDATGTATAGAVAASATAAMSLAASGTAVATTTTTAALTIAASATALATTTTTAALVLAATAIAQVSAASTAVLVIAAGPVTVAAPTTATAALVIAATGTARAAGTSTASLTIAATGTAQLAGSNTASLVLDGIATARAVGTSTATLVLDATGTARAAGSSTASLVLASTGTASATSTSTASMTLDATGIARAAGSSTGVLTIAATGTARATSTSTATLAVVATGTARAATTSTGTMTIAATAVASTTATATMTIAATGTARAAGTSTASLVIAGTAVATLGGTQTATMTLGAIATAAATSTSTGSLTLAATGTAQGASTSTAALTLVATGTARASSTSTASLTLVATATPAARATTNASLVIDATAVANLAGTNTALLTIASSATARGTASSTASLTLAATATISTSATATMTLGGTATARAALTSTAVLTLDSSGVARAAGASTGSLTVAATGVARAAGASTAVLTVTATGAAAVTASSTAAMTLAGTAAASITVTASTATLTLAAIGAAQVAGSSTAALVLDAVASATFGGTSTASLTLAADGSAQVTGSCSAVLSLVAIGAATVATSSTATLSLAAIASAAVVALSAAVLDLVGTGQAAGAASAEATLVLSGVAITGVAQSDFEGWGIPL